MNRVTFDKEMLSTFGIYQPSESKEKVDALAAESKARAEALSYMTHYFEEHCSSKPKDGWQKQFHSQGSHIYRNGVWTIALEAKISALFSDETNPCH